MSELILVFDDASYMALQASKMLEEVELDTESLGSWKSCSSSRAERRKS